MGAALIAGTFEVSKVRTSAQREIELRLNESYGVDWGDLEIYSLAMTANRYWTKSRETLDLAPAVHLYLRFAWPTFNAEMKRISTDCAEIAAATGIEEFPVKIYERLLQFWESNADRFFVIWLLQAATNDRYQVMTPELTKVLAEIAMEQRGTEELKYEFCKWINYVFLPNFIK